MRGRGIASVAYAAAFGLVLFQMHRVGGVVWFVANHTSAAWLLLPFLIGAMHPDLGRAVAYGMVAPVVALIAFYAFSPWWGPNLISERYYLQWLLGALLTGPVCGALGHWWRARGSRAAGVAIAAAFVLEPFAWVAVRGYLHGPLWVWCVEVAFGLAAAVLASCPPGLRTADRRSSRKRQRRCPRRSRAPRPRPPTRAGRTLPSA